MLQQSYDKLFWKVYGVYYIVQAENNCTLKWSLECKCGDSSLTGQTRPLASVSWSFESHQKWTPN